MTPSKRGLARQTDSPSLKKRKQLTMDDYASSVCISSKSCYLLDYIKVFCISFIEAIIFLWQGKRRK